MCSTLDLVPSGDGTFFSVEHTRDESDPSAFLETYPGERATLTPVCERIEASDYSPEYKQKLQRLLITYGAGRKILQQVPHTPAMVHLYRSDADACKRYQVNSQGPQP